MDQVRPARAVSIREAMTGGLADRDGLIVRDASSAEPAGWGIYHEPLGLQRFPSIWDHAVMPYGRKTLSPSLPLPGCADRIRNSAANAGERVLMPT
jgi:hypothetical protein